MKKGYQIKDITQKFLTDKGVFLNSYLKDILNKIKNDEFKTPDEIINAIRNEEEVRMVKPSNDDFYNLKKSLI